MRIVPRESFTPTRHGVIRNLEDAAQRQSFANPAERELAAFWHSRHDDIQRLANGADTLGRQLREEPLPGVLCHADLHTWNVLIGSEQDWWLVDWDDVILAPKERDLMFVVGGIGRDLVSPHDTECFFYGYGKTKAHTRALIYYCYAWAVQDIAAYGERVFFLPGLGQETRAHAVQGLISLFEPGNIATLALTENASVA